MDRRWLPGLDRGRYQFLTALHTLRCGCLLLSLCCLFYLPLITHAGFQLDTDYCTGEPSSPPSTSASLTIFNRGFAAKCDVNAVKLPCEVWGGGYEGGRPAALQSRSGGSNTIGERKTIDFGNGITFNGVSSRHFGFAAFYNDGVAQWATLGGGTAVEFGDRSTAVTYGDDVYVAFQTQDSDSVFSLSGGGCAPVAFNGESLVVARLSATTGACVWLHTTSATDNIIGYVAHRLY